ncbi:carbohydrate ABC transporter permease [Anaerocolumna chitinilytica]|uniref:ABC transporter permease n=1 Tax=Anaerocolumna chitinilytica TaxID=1727145 RepID=A0A7I8DPC5_9FIRM|nr:sugar ABC transporter permease [Anaerocolumna chitinilytica]BCJ99164.1 ABC transporter permease [Anaerocolumna chitinilytica]
MKKVRKTKSLVMPRRMYLFVLPALTLFLVFWIFPVLQLFYYSITNFNGINYNTYKFVGMNNYIRLLKEGTLLNSIENTLKYTFIIVLLCNLLGLLLAMLLNLKIKGKTFFRTAAYIPALFSAIVIGYIWSYVYMPENGMIASLVNLFGMDSSKLNILGNFKTALFGISIVDVWKNVGTTMIIYLAGLQTVDDSLLEAGRIDGCSEWGIIRRIKIPLISATITINVVLTVISGLKAFDYSFIMTNGGPGKSTNTLMYTIYKIAFTDQMMGKASAFSVVSFIVIILITIAMLVVLNKKEVEL